MTAIKRRPGVISAVLALSLGYSSLAGAASCFVDYYDDIYLDFCAQQADQGYCDYWLDFTDVGVGTYSSGDCAEENLLGYCERAELPFPPKRLYYYSDNSTGNTAESLSEACEYEDEDGFITPGVWNGACEDDCPEPTPDDGYPAVEDPLDLEGLLDANGDGVPDMAILNVFYPRSAGPVVALISGTDGSLINPIVEGFSIESVSDENPGIEFFNSNYRPLRMDTGADANMDGVSTDPFIAVLAKNRKTNETWVQVRAAIGGQKVGRSLRFFNENYVAIDVAVLDDTNGDGVSNDPSVAVLAQKTSSGRQAVILRSLVTGKKLGNWTVTQANSDVIAIVGETVAGSAPNNARLAILAVKNSGSNAGNSSVVQVRVADGSVLSKKTVSDSALEVVDMAVRRGGAGDGTTNAPAIVVLGAKANGTSKVLIRDLKSNAKQGSITFLSGTWASNFAAVIPDIDSNGEEDIFVIADKPSGDVRLKGADPESGESGKVDMDTYD